jgi:hypothetical protein
MNNKKKRKKENALRQPGEALPVACHMLIHLLSHQQMGVKCQALCSG